jgi:hypothetical protein
MVKVNKKVQLSDSELTELVKASLKRDEEKAKTKTFRRKTRFWSQVNVQNRYVADKLNELSALDHQIFAVNQSQGVGGTYEIVYYIDKLVEE